MKIAFTRKRHSWLSSLIRFFTQGKWSHVFIVTDVKIEGDFFILESSMLGGVKVNILRSFLNQKFDLEIFEIKPEVKTDISGVVKYIGTSYGYWQSIGYVLMKLFFLKKNPFVDGFWCSEYVLRFLLDSDTKPYFQHLEVDPNSATPQNLYDVVTKCNLFTKI